MSDVLHCWFDFDDGHWLDGDMRVPGHTCMLEDNHSGPHEPTSDDDIGVSFVEVSAPKPEREGSSE